MPQPISCFLKTTVSARFTKWQATSALQAQLQAAVDVKRRLVINPDSSSTVLFPANDHVLLDRNPVDGVMWLVHPPENCTRLAEIIPMLCLLCCCVQLWSDSSAESNVAFNDEAHAAGRGRRSSSTKHHVSNKHGISALFKMGCTSAA